MPIKKTDIEIIIKEHRLTSCFECGKCTANCPLAEFFGDDEFGFTPRAIIEKALIDPDLITGDVIWYCLTCDSCAKGCPSGVMFRDFVEALRQMVIGKGNTEYGVLCKHCGKYFLPLIAQKYLLKKIDRDSQSVDFLRFCPSCRRRIYSRLVKKSFYGR